MAFALKLLFCFALFILLRSTVSNSLVRLQRMKETARNAYRLRREAAWTRCSNQPDGGPLPHLPRESHSGPEPASRAATRSRRAVHKDMPRSQDTALQLTGNTGLLLGEENQVPEHAFTLTLWCKPEGGQPSPAIMLEAEDMCTPFPGRGWKLGAHSPEHGGEREMRIFFTLHTASRFDGSIITAPLPFSADRWFHIAVVYDGVTLILFIDGAQVAVTKEQKSRPSSSPLCRSLSVGGKAGHHFRGRLDDFRLWSTPLGQRDVQKAMTRTLQLHRLRPALADDFDTVDGWEWNGHQRGETAGPMLVTSAVPSTPSPLQLRPNPCGFTVCDVPKVTRSYHDNWELRQPKVVRYRVVVVSNDDGSDPVVSEEQIRSQHAVIQRAFSPYNITWEVETLLVNSSILRKRCVLLGCNSHLVGNGQCETECRHPATGNDGGDCDREMTCEQHLLGNGNCNPQCNTAYHNWDEGDCCTAENSTCYDPSSPYRSYMDVDELKASLQLNNSRHINVLFAQWTNRDVRGVATFPWEKIVRGEQGGIVLQTSEFGREGHMTTLVHELGHALGLWHVHYGVSELGCYHPCYEIEADFTKGDLCSDTAPTPINENCKDPSPELSWCGKSQFTDTPFTNYMGYADDDCIKEFTPQQVARMHCYLDLIYTSNQRKIQEQLSPPPLSPKVVAVTPSSVTLSWLPPLPAEAFYDIDICSSCTDNLEFCQYGHRAESNSSPPFASGTWTPSQATGPPDAEPCSPSYKGWVPNRETCSLGDCMLTVYFKYPVVPSLLLVWVTWNAYEGLQEVEIVFSDGSSDVKTRFHSQCDVPLSIPLFSDKSVAKIHIRTRNQFVSVDALQLISVPNNPECAPCKPFRFRVWREPPFHSGNTRESDSVVFTDSLLQQGMNYTYRVQAWLGSRFSSLSPPLLYVVGDPVCGDGKVESDESCDDGNIFDGDGCSSDCAVEEFFHCSGNPSLCYWYQDDGRCEDFELSSSVKDCGHFTPAGSKDQWAESINVGPEDISVFCSPQVVSGPPVLPLKCQDEPDSKTSWSPCKFPPLQDYWMEARFQTPVVATSVHLFLASDGLTTNFLQWPAHATIYLLDPEGSPHHKQSVDITCFKNPQEIAILWDLTRPFSLTAAVNVTFSIAEIAFTAVRLRSLDTLNPVKVGQCSSRQLYHPRLQECVHFCAMPSCPSLAAKHARLTCSGAEEGDTCSVTCEPGHRRPMGQRPMVCMGGEWRGPVPNCKPLDCGMPLVAHADAICPNGTSFGKSCVFKCRPPARMKGGANGMATITCEASGMWSQSDDSCQLSCPPPSALTHAVLVNPRCRKADSLVYGQTCRFRCKVGFYVAGYSMRKRTLYLRCDLTATWSGPRCVPVTCPALSGPHHNCTAGNRAESECSMLCPTKPQESGPTVHRCEYDGTWNPPLSECLPAARCLPPKTEDKNVLFLCDGNHFGAVCKATCSHPDEQPMTSLISEDKIRIRCGSNGRWSPSPEDFVCRRKCYQNDVADGYCDADNNHLHCGWDGGDCCASTAARNVVNPFPPSCGELCRCLDPQAAENLAP